MQKICYEYPVNNEAKIMILIHFKKRERERDNSLNEHNFNLKSFKL